ncbi:MAG TPA: NAD(P)/FAD-dependent oxidoreductase [Kofleriaceae bacterium]|nr:NAD(P)/FAD-dependent oxidoreductase [Kofleriaceae bacterium]
MANARIRIAVLGGGPAGLVTALALERYARGTVDVTLFDRNATETDYPGVEYGIQERACRALHRIGLKDAALRRGLPNREIVFRVGSTGGGARVQGRVRTDPAWCVCVVRQEFLADLATLLTSTQVRRRTIVERIALGPDRTVQLSVRRPDDEGCHDDTFDCVVAADGVNSIVRKQLFAPWATLHDRGFSSLYLLIDGRGHDALASRFRALANEGRSELMLGSETTWTFFPLGDDRLAVGVGFPHAVRDRLWAEQGAGAGQEWSALSAAQKRAIALRLTDDMADDRMLLRRLFEELVRDWDSFRIYLWAMRDSDPLPQPYLDESNVVAIGDAAHAFMPTIGMGASLAIEDAEALAARVARVASAHPEPDDFRAALRAEAFIPFTRDRVPLWNELMVRARWAARANFLHARPRNRFALAPQVPGYLRSRAIGAMEWLVDVGDRIWLMATKPTRASRPRRGEPQP